MARQDRMKDLLNLLRWQDVLDILILTFVFYRLFLWMRRKRALRMIMALLALPFFYIMAQWIDLPLSVWGLKNLWAVILLVLVVIFQQEIREVLGSLNLPTFFLGRPEQSGPGSMVLEKIVGAAFRMIDKGIGGLIVVQRRDDLDEFIHGKTLLDAEINEDILISIFNPQSPLHDGAVIIQGDRIRYATALLPVSQTPSFPKEWGTRHRAGLGITEISDAECIIISEERKEVLFACKGKIEKKEGREDLKNSLSHPFSLSGKKNGEKGWLKKLFKDLPVKVLFLFLVCLLWIFVVGLRQGEISFNIPIEYYSVPQNLEIEGEPPKEINVRLRGSQRLLSALAPDRLRVQVDLSKGHPGMNQVSLSETNMNVPSGITVTNFYPRKIRFRLSKIPTPNQKPLR
jgi:diadenylate cyclase